MFIYGGNSPMWMDISDPKQCGIFCCGCNVFRGAWLDYVEYVGSQTNSIIFT